MKAATHKGTCQACGRIQKLPNGVVAAHGYTTRWGFFSGTCPGSGEKPFEISADYIERTIVRAQDSIARLEDAAASVRAETGESGAAWYYIYNSLIGAKSWERVVVVEGGQINVVQEGKTKTHKVFGLSGDIAADARTLNERRAKAYETDTTRYREYIHWQNERIANWKPGTLSPV